MFGVLQNYNLGGRGRLHGSTLRVSGERVWREGQTLNRARKAGGVGRWDEKAKPRAARAEGRGAKS